MEKEGTIAKAIRVLSCLVVAFALVFFPPTSAHAAAGAHGGHSAVEQGKTASLQNVHSHSGELLDCGSKKTDTSMSDSSALQCCAGMCLADILIEGFALPQAGASVIDLAIPHALLIAADTSGFLRPPKHLI
jgi:hypothetical protein